MVIHDFYSICEATIVSSIIEGGVQLSAIGKNFEETGTQHKKEHTLQVSVEDPDPDRSYPIISDIRYHILSDPTIKSNKTRKKSNNLNIYFLIYIFKKCNQQILNKKQKNVNKFTVFRIRISFYADPDPGFQKCLYGSRCGCGSRSGSKGVTIEEENVKKRAVNMISGLTGTTYDEKCRESGLESLEERRRKQELLQAYKILSGKDNIHPERNNCSPE